MKRDGVTRDRPAGRRLMRWLAPLLLILAGRLFWLAGTEAGRPERAVLERYRIRDYEVRILWNYSCSLFRTIPIERQCRAEIRQGRRLIWSWENYGIYTLPGTLTPLGCRIQGQPSTRPVEVRKGIRPGQDITGDGMPDVVVSGWGANGGVHGFVFSLGRRLTQAGAFLTYPDSIRLSDVDGDGVPEVIASCPVRGMSLGAPVTVIFKPQGGVYRVAPELMRRRAPGSAEASDPRRGEANRRHPLHPPRVTR